MDPSTLLIVVAVLACPIAMGGMLWMMNKNMTQRDEMGKAPRPGRAAKEVRLAELRQQQEAIEAQIADLKARPEAPASGVMSSPRAAEDTAGR